MLYHFRLLMQLEWKANANNDMQEGVVRQIYLSAFQQISFGSRGTKLNS
jgi:hypothetical protein